MRLEGFLSLGRSLIEQAITSPDICPLCLQPKPWELLKQELQVRIDKLKESKQKYDRALKSTKHHKSQLWRFHKGREPTASKRYKCWPQRRVQK